MTPSGVAASTRIKGQATSGSQSCNTLFLPDFGSTASHGLLNQYLKNSVQDRMHAQKRVAGTKTHGAAASDAKHQRDLEGYHSRFPGGDCKPTWDRLHGAGVLSSAAQRPSPGVSVTDSNSTGPIRQADTALLYLRPPG